MWEYMEKSESGARPSPGSFF